MLLESLQTPRLTFRSLTMKDVDEWMQYFSNPKALEFMPFILGDRAACENWIKKQIERYEKYNMGLCALIEKASGKMVGQCGLLVQEIDGVEELEVGYHLIPEYWKKGYATEAAIACKEFAFKNNIRDSLISIIHVNNFNSQQVALRNGMQKEKQTVWRDLPVYVFRVRKSNDIGSFHGNRS